MRAKEAIAESYYLRGGIHEAAMQLQELARRDDLDYYQRARITARINELRLELAKMGLEETEDRRPREPRTPFSAHASHR